MGYTFVNLSSSSFLAIGRLEGHQPGPSQPHPSIFLNVFEVFATKSSTSSLTLFSPISWDGHQPDPSQPHPPIFLNVLEVFAAKSSTSSLTVFNPIS